MIGAGGKFFGGVVVPAGGGGGGGVTEVLARNGLSLDPASTMTDPIIVLGDDDNGLATFLNERWIDQNGNALILKGIGNTVTNADPSIIFIEDPSRVAANSPFLQFLNGGFSLEEIGRIDFDDFENTWIGFHCGLHNISGDGNTAVGKNALASLATGNHNSAFGINSLILNISGNNNNAFGINALGNISTGNNNVGFGNNTLFDETTGSGNIGIGSGAGSFVQGGTDNVFIGFESGLGFTAAAEPSSRNTFIGASINVFDQFGDDNIIVGFGNNESGITGSDNIILGENNVFTGDNVTIIGSGFTTALSDIMFISPAGQNAVVGAALTGQADDGNTLQVYGTESLYDLPVPANPYTPVVRDQTNNILSLDNTQTTPSVLAGTNVTIGSIVGSDVRGILNVTVGAGGLPFGSTVATFTITTPFAGVPLIFLTANNGAAATVNNLVFANQISPTAWAITTAGIVPTGSYTWYYLLTPNS